MYKILIIEDDLVMAGAIKKEMEAWGNEVWSTSGAFGYYASFL